MKNLLFLLFLITSINLNASVISLYTQLSLNGGTGSGSGYWVWTDPAEEGNLLIQPGFGLSLGMQAALKYILVDTSFRYIYSQVGQNLEGDSYIYKQHSFEWPLLLGMPLPYGNGRSIICLGPTLHWLPFEAHRTGPGDRMDSSFGGNPIQVGITAGVKYNLSRRVPSPWQLSLMFVHPFISPEYHWDEQSKGNFRINHFDFAIAYSFLQLGKKHYD